MLRIWRKSWTMALALLCLALPVFAQVQAGDLKLNLRGDLQFGYGGSFSDTGDSSHNLLVGGDGQLTGSYYSPKFISFQIRPYYDRNQQNSNFQLVNNTSGVTSEASFFSGSHFPGSFSFSDDRNSTGTLGLAEASGLATDGSGRSWNLSWSALVPKLPTLAVSFTKARGASEVYGANEASSSTARTLNLTSTYSVAGFQMNGSYLNMATGVTTPSFLSGEAEGATTDNRSQALIFNVNHRIPWHGFVMGSASQFQSASNFLGQTSDNTTHNYAGNASVFPIARLSLNGGMNYSDNLNGALNQQLIQQGSAPVIDLGSGKSDSLNTYGSAGLALFRGLSINAGGNHVVQHFAGTTHESTQFSGTATFNYTRRFLGSLTFTGGAVDTATEQGNGGVGLIGNVNLSRKLGHWDFGGQFGYSQSVQTLLATYTTSSYTYNADIRRQFGNHSWAAYFSGAHSGLRRTEGSNHSESVGTTFGGRHFSVNGVWGESMGLSILTSKGLTAAPASLPLEVLSPETIIMYNGTHYGFGGSLSLMKRLQLVGNYSNSSNSTLAGLKSTLGETSMANVTLRYPLRKMFFNAGYTRLGQTVTAAGGSPIVVTSYYFGISRWFNFF